MITLNTFILKQVVYGLTFINNNIFINKSFYGSIHYAFIYQLFISLSLKV